MKRFRLGVLVMAAAAAVVAAGCDDGGSGDAKAIVVSDAAALKQTVFADSSEGAREIVFTTTGAWTSGISEVTETEDTRMNITNPGTTWTPPAWISINPSEGKSAGNYTVTISVEPNYSGADRTAKIVIECDGERITVEVTQTSDKEDGTPMEPPTLEDLEEEFAQLLEQYEGMFLAVEDIFLEIDNDYPTFESRQPVTASTPVLYEFFKESYKAVRTFNYIKENIDILTDLSEYERAVIKGKAMMYRGAVYFYLNTLFGGIQLVANSDPDQDLPRSTAEEVRGFIIADLDIAFVVVPAAKANEAWLFKLKLLMAQSQYGAATEVASQIIATGNLVFADTNGDGLPTADDRDALVYVQTYLLAAEAANESGDTGKAIGYINILYRAFGLATELTQETPASQVRSTIRSIFGEWNNGMKFLNNFRWNSEGWGKHALMPIPQSAINLDSNLTQNPGWE